MGKHKAKEKGNHPGNPDARAGSSGYMERSGQGSSEHVEGEQTR